jgi:signal transduction histidine kinase
MPILGIFPDRSSPGGEALWIVTPKALHRVDRGRIHLTGTFSFSQKEIFSINDVIVSSDNYLWCATPNGVYKISLSTFHRMSVNPKVAITSVMQDTMRLFRHTGIYTPNHEPELEYRQNNVTIEYAGLSFVSESDISYIYQLEPAERSWSQPTHDTHIQLRNLESGEYLFRVAAVSADGVVSSNPAVFTFRILPPFWERWWFLALSGVFLAGLAFAGVRYVVQRKLRIQARKFERQQALQQERDRISRDLHDNVGAQLVNIISGLELAGRYSDSQFREIKNILTSLNEDTRVTMALLRETIWALHTPGMVVEKFAQELEHYIRKQLRYHPGITLQFHVEGNANAALRPVEAMNLLRVIQEALSNSLKHASPATIILRIHIEENNSLHIYFWNDGCFETVNEELSGGKGIPNMERRVSELGGTFHFFRNDDRTASVELSIPLAKE